MERWFQFLYVVALVFALGIEPGFAKEGSAAFTLKAIESDGWVIEFVSGAESPLTIQIEGKPHILFSGPANLDGAADPAGFPLLTVEALTIGVPLDASLQVELVEPVYEEIPNQLIAPHPRYILDSDKEPVPEYRKNASSYSTNNFFPSRQLAVDPPVMLRNQRIATVRLSLYQYNPVTQTLRKLISTKLRVSLRDPHNAPMTIPSPTGSAPDPFFEDTYRKLLWNYEQAKGWRKNESSNLGKLTDPTRDWFETGRAYYRIRVADDAWYKVTKAQLVAAGALSSQIDPPTMKLYEKGIQIPIVVRPDTSVEFYGKRNHGDSIYTDFYTDTTTYWLTWGGTPGLRFTPSFTDSVSVQSDIRSGITTKHFEENNYYFWGTDPNDIINIEEAPGEGWIWGDANDQFYPDRVKDFRITLDNIDTTAQLATLRARLVSMTLNYATPNHHAQFRIVGTRASSDQIEFGLVGQIFFPGRTSTIFTSSFSRYLLGQGVSDLRIRAIPTLAFPNQFYLDWFEIDYNRLLLAQNNYLTFYYPSTGMTGRLLFTATGFTSPEIEVYDLLTQRKITGTRLILGADDYSIRFRDSLSTPRKFVVVAPGGARPVSDITQKFFGDIRVNPAGADYIIITHQDFMEAAQQLAAHRQTLNGFRTKVIDVQDIYDEFNYGILNATKIRTFLKHAYQNWLTPKPAYVLMLGDASWDFHRFLSNSINTNYVPSYGVPSSDNWFVCFNPDTGALPFMYMGRLPVHDPVQAQHTIQKVIGYDSYTLSEWNKNFLFVAGTGYGGASDVLINNKVLPPPIGGTAFRAYKTTSGTIDGEHKARMKEIVRNGVVFLNFIGHSGGRVWEVDIGPPDELENTNGKLPFLASVSCNVGAFADPVSYVLAEDFILADNRGSIASWASSTLGYPTYGNVLTNDFLQGVRDSVRALGPLTTNAKIKMLRAEPGNYLANATVKTNNLLGDPASRFAMPTKPDFAITSQQITSNNPTPTPLDSLAQVKVTVANYGLVPPDSVGVSVTDMFNGNTTFLVDNKKLAPIRQIDSITIEWRGMDKVGRHVFSASADPGNLITEVSELNNVGSREQYVYANVLSISKPIRNTVVAPGLQRLVVTSPLGIDSAGFMYEFQLDTVDTFDSPALVTSGNIVPTLVTGEWTTSFLPGGRLYFWRARTMYGQIVGKWVESSFATSNDAPALPIVRWRENTTKQFRRDLLRQTQATDSGVTIAATPPIDLFARSVGSHYNPLAEYYSIIRVNEQRITGYNFDPVSFLVARLNDFTGAVEFKTFHTSAFPPSVGLAEARRMTTYINETPLGNYLAFSVVLDGATGVTESLKVAIELLGSTRIRLVEPYDCWAFIARKVNGATEVDAIESYSRADTAGVFLRVPNYYSYGSGSITSLRMSIPNSWNSFHWQASCPGPTNARLAFLGVRPGGATDTLRILPRDSSDVDLAFMNSITSGERYTSIQMSAILSTSDAVVTPVLQEWRMDYVPPPDLAVSARTIGLPEPNQPNTQNIAVTVYNIGYLRSDSASVTISAFDKNNRARKLTTVPVQPLNVEQFQTITVPISTSNLPRRATLQIEIIPGKRAKDLITENNIGYYTLVTPGTSVQNGVQVFADGVEIMDGDYVAAKPTFVIRPKHSEAVASVAMYIDNQPYGGSSLHQSEKILGERSASEFSFNPTLNDGNHSLRFQLVQANEFGEIDTVNQSLRVNVLSESRIMQVYNFPNPFKSETSFTFMLTGAKAVESLSIRIFTVAGRKIRQLDVPGNALKVGFNRVYWDGRDSDGDEIANGYYFYQVSIHSEGKSISSIEKLVKVK